MLQREINNNNQVKEKRKKLWRTPKATWKDLFLIRQSEVSSTYIIALQ